MRESDVKLATLILAIFAGSIASVQGASLSCYSDCRGDSIDPPIHCNTTSKTCTGSHELDHNACYVYLDIQSGEVNRQCVASTLLFGICTHLPIGKECYDRGWCEACCYGDYCNTDEFVQDLMDYSQSLQVSPTTTSGDSPTITGSGDSTVSPGSSGSPPTQAPAYAIAVISVLSIIVVVILTVIGVALCIHYYPHCLIGSINATVGTPTMTLETGSDGEPSLNELLEDSGSGSGLPLLIQRSIAGQISLHELIGKGRFGEVWKGSYKGDEVAVKVFQSREEPSWVHEVNIYQTCLIRHPNILRFIAADNKDVGTQTQLWLITEFCEYGSLYDLLVNQTVNEATMLRLAYTAACGLDHLHTEIVGTEGKPPIVHRDIKSRNILVKNDFSCCIADLGLALRYETSTNTLEDLPSKRVGTRRYLAPEIIDESISAKNFEAFKRSDVYSFGLVLWEVARRGECAGYTEEPQLPYYDHVTIDPSFEDMRRVVVTERRRPSIPNRWSQSETFHGLSRIIQQCWLHESEARLSSLRVKKSLANLHTTKNEKAENS